MIRNKNHVKQKNYYWLVGTDFYGKMSYTQLGKLKWDTINESYNSVLVCKEKQCASEKMNLSVENSLLKLALCNMRACACKTL